MFLNQTGSLWCDNQIEVPRDPIHTNHATQRAHYLFPSDFWSPPPSPSSPSIGLTMFDKHHISPSQTCRLALSFFSSSFKGIFCHLEKRKLWHFQLRPSEDENKSSCEKTGGTTMQVIYIFLHRSTFAATKTSGSIFPPLVQEAGDPNWQQKCL